MLFHCWNGVSQIIVWLIVACVLTPCGECVGSTRIRLLNPTSDTPYIALRVDNTDDVSAMEFSIDGVVTPLSTMSGYRATITNDEIALYGGSPALALNASSMSGAVLLLASGGSVVDFVQWGAGSQTGVTEALTATKWDTAGAFVSGKPPYVAVIGDPQNDFGSTIWRESHTPTVRTVMSSTPIIDAALCQEYSYGITNTTVQALQISTVVYVHTGVEPLSSIKCRTKHGELVVAYGSHIQQLRVTVGTVSVDATVAEQTLPGTFIAGSNIIGMAVSKGDDDEIVYAATDRNQIWRMGTSVPIAGIVNAIQGGIAVTFAGHLLVTNQFGSGSVTRYIPVNPATGVWTAETIVTTHGINTPAADTEATTTQFFRPSGICVDSDDRIRVLDSDGVHSRIREISPAGVLTTMVGGVGTGSVDGPYTTAQFGNLSATCVHLNGNMYIIDVGDQKMLEISNIMQPQPRIVGIEKQTTHSFRVQLSDVVQTVAVSNRTELNRVLSFTPAITGEYSGALTTSNGRSSMIVTTTAPLSDTVFDDLIITPSFAGAALVSTKNISLPSRFRSYSVPQYLYNAQQTGSVDPVISVLADIHIADDGVCVFIASDTGVYFFTRDPHTKTITYTSKVVIADVVRVKSTHAGATMYAMYGSGIQAYTRGHNGADWTWTPTASGTVSWASVTTVAKNVHVRTSLQYYVVTANAIAWVHHNGTAWCSDHSTCHVLTDNAWNIADSAHSSDWSQLYTLDVGRTLRVISTDATGSETQLRLVITFDTSIECASLALSPYSTHLYASCADTANVYLYHFTKDAGGFWTQGVTRYETPSTTSLHSIALSNDASQLIGVGGDERGVPTIMYGVRNTDTGAIASPLRTLVVSTAKVYARALTKVIITPDNTQALLWHPAINRNPTVLAYERFQTFHVSLSSGAITLRRHQLSSLLDVMVNNHPSYAAAAAAVGGMIMMGSVFAHISQTVTAIYPSESVTVTRLVVKSSTDVSGVTMVTAMMNTLGMYNCSISLAVTTQTTSTYSVETVTTWGGHIGRSDLQGMSYGATTDTIYIAAARAHQILEWSQPSGTPTSIAGVGTNLPASY